MSVGKAVVIDNLSRHFGRGCIAPADAVGAGAVAGQRFLGGVRRCRLDRACEQVGFLSRAHDLPADTGQEDLRRLIEDLNADPQIDGILSDEAWRTATRTRRGRAGTPLLAGGGQPGGMAVDERSQTQEAAALGKK